MVTTQLVQNVIVTDAMDPSATGCATWWRAAPVDFAALTAGLTAAGIDTKLLPGQVTDATAFRRALDMVVPSTRKDQIDITPLGDTSCFAVERKSVSGRDLTHHTLFKALLKEDGSIMVWEKDDGHIDVARKLEAAYQRNRTQLDGYDVGMWLAYIVPRLNAVTLRDRGGIYYIPPTTVKTWQTIAGVLGELSGTRIFEMPAMECDKACEAILDAVQREAEEAAQKMEDDIINSDLSAQSLKNRAAKLDKILSKVNSYEAILGKSLDAFHTRADNLSAQITAAILTASVEDVA